MRTGISFFVAGLFFSSTAQAITLGFENIVADDEGLYLQGDYQESGFTISDPYLAVFGNNTQSYLGSNHDSAYLVNCGGNYFYDGYGYGPDCYGGGVTLTHESSLFTLHSLDAAVAGFGSLITQENLYEDPVNDGLTFFLEVIGHVDGSSEALVQKFEFVWPDDIYQMRELSFSSEWTNLTSVEIGALYASSCAEFLFEEYNPVATGCLEYRPYGEFGSAFDPALDNINVSLVSTVVPLPAAVWLFGSGLGLLGWFGRNRIA